MLREIILYVVAFATVIPFAYGQQEGGSDTGAKLSVGEIRGRISELEERLLELEAVVGALKKELASVETRSAEVQSDAALRDENERLRKSVRLLYGGRVENLPKVPMPNRDLLEEVLSNAGLRTQYEAQMEALEKKPESKAMEPFEVIKEWGRTPEAVAQLNGNYSTLKGLSIFMQPNVSREDLEAYGRTLHNLYRDYDNLNIEIFDRRDAAVTFGDKGTIDMTFRVMSISKHRKAGRDVILVGRGTSMQVVL